MIFSWTPGKSERCDFFFKLLFQILFDLIWGKNIHSASLIDRCYFIMCVGQHATSCLLVTHCCTHHDVSWSTWLHHHVLVGEEEVSSTHPPTRGLPPPSRVEICARHFDFSHGMPSFSLTPPDRICFLLCLLSSSSSRSLFAKCKITSGICPHPPNPLTPQPPSRSPSLWLSEDMDRLEAHHSCIMVFFLGGVY